LGDQRQFVSVDDSRGEELRRCVTAFQDFARTLHDPCGKVRRLRRRHRQRFGMLPEIGCVPSGVVEVMRKQQQGWACIRS